MANRHYLRKRLKLINICIGLVETKQTQKFLRCEKYDKQLSSKTFFFIMLL